MGARWNWEAICPNGHEYGNFSGGADECYICDQPPEVVFDGDDANEQKARWKRRKRGERCQVIELPNCPACGAADCEGRFSIELKEKS